MIRNLIIAGALATAPITINNAQGLQQNRIYFNLGESYSDSNYNYVILNSPEKTNYINGLYSYSGNAFLYEHKSTQDQVYNKYTYVLFEKYILTSTTQVTITAKQINEQITANTTNLVDNGTNVRWFAFMGDTTTYESTKLNIDSFLERRTVNNLTFDGYNAYRTLFDVYGNPASYLETGVQDTITWVNGEYTNTNTIGTEGLYIAYCIDLTETTTNTDYFNYWPYRLFKIPNYIDLTATWTVPDTQQYEVVDIPGLMLSILGMPFAFISQAFNLTVFPGTPYALNLSHLLLALICAGILIFLIKKVIR